jgi:AhpD family alkylhydroperoxidase
MGRRLDRRLLRPRAHAPALMAAGSTTPLVALVTKDEAPDDVRAVLEGGEATYGRILHTWQALAQRPEIFVAYLPYLRSIVGPGELEQRTREIVEVRTAVLNRCLYSTSHRVRSAKAAGVPEDDLVAVARGDLARFRAVERSRALPPPDGLRARHGPAAARDRGRAVAAGRSALPLARLRAPRPRPPVRNRSPHRVARAVREEGLNVCGAGTRVCRHRPRASRDILGQRSGGGLSKRSPRSLREPTPLEGERHTQVSRTRR